MSLKNPWVEQCQAHLDPETQVLVWESLPLSFSELMTSSFSSTSDNSHTQALEGSHLHLQGI